MSDGSSALTEAMRAYLQLWRDLPREALSLALAVPVTLIAASLCGVALALAAGLIGILIGLVFVPLALYGARLSSGASRRLDLLAGRPRVPEPQWRRPPATVAPATFALYGPVIDGHYWLALLHAVAVGPLMAVLFAGLLSVWAWAGIGTLISTFDGNHGASGAAHLLAEAATSWLGFPEPAPLLVSLADVAMIVLFTSTLPFVTRGLTLTRYLADRLLLGPWSSEALQREVAELSASRGAAVAAEDRALRRLERDIHDGPQQRLIRVQMDLGSALTRVRSDPEAAAALIDEARDHVRSALDELRALSRGVAPPILQDRGFEAAVHSLAAMSPTAVDVVVEHRIELVPPEVERSVYFVLAELLANASKHARATSVRVHLDLRDADAAGERWLDAWVIDDGVGGATSESGHGLEGVAGRIHGLRGVLTVESPLGGPTTIGVHVPFRPAASPALS